MARTKKETIVTTEEVIEKVTSSDIDTKKIKELKDTDEIEVKSLIPNVSYYDKKTGDTFEWDEVGHTELIPFSTLKEMRRNYKIYFNELWLRPMDERVISQFGLNRIYNNYESLFDKSSYTKTNISDTCKKFKEVPNNLKWTIVGKVKDLVVNGDITDINVIRTLERQIGIDLLYLL